MVFRCRIGGRDGRSLQIKLPGIGSYVAKAIEKRNLFAIGWAIAAMTATILIYDQLLFRPVVAWADKFRVEQTAAQVVPRSWVLDLCRRRWPKRIVAPFGWLGSSFRAR